MYVKKYVGSLGEISPSLCYRIDTEIVNKGYSYLMNARPNTSGGLTNFPALEKVSDIGYAGISALKIFKYKMNGKDAQFSGLLFIFTDRDLKIVRQDNFQILGTIASGYTAYEIKNKLSITQFENSIIVCCEGKKPFMVRVIERSLSFTVVDYWESIVNPPVKGVVSEYKYSGDDNQVFSWYKEGTKVIFVGILDQVYEPSFLQNLSRGKISFYGGEFYIDSVSDTSGKQKFTTTQMVAPELEVPANNASGDDKKINILDIRFSENLFKDDGYPAVVCNYAGRIVFGNVAGNPSAIVASRVNDSLNFRSSLDDSDGFTTFIPDNELNVVKDLIPYKSLIAFTDKGVYSTLLNSVLVPKESSLYEQRLSKPKGSTNSWLKAGGTLYYIDASNRINKVEDIGADSAYQTYDISTYAPHLFQNVEKLYYTEYDKQNFIGVDTGDGNRVLVFNDQQDIMAWSRTYRLTGEIEYVEIDDTLYIFNITSSGISIYRYSKTVTKGIEFHMPAPTISQRVELDVPCFCKDYRIGKVIIACYGNYNFDVNGEIKERAFNDRCDSSSFYNELQVVEFSNVGGKDLKIKQRDSEKIEVLSVFYEIKNYDERK